MNVFYIRKNSISETSIIDDTAILEEGVTIGNNVIIGKNVVIGKNTTIMHNCVIEDNTIIGENCKIYYGSIIGSNPQDVKYKNENTRVVIGNNNTIREYVTINKACYKNSETKIGNNNLIMTYTHIAHDCLIGDNNIFSNSVNFGGHCIVHNNSVIGGMVGIHQFVRIGSYSMIGGMSRITQDVPPFVTVVRDSNNVEGLNLIGLRRNHFDNKRIKNIQHAYNLIYKSKLTFQEILNELEKMSLDNKDIKYLFEFLLLDSKRGISGICKNKLLKVTDDNI
jgi:UDP-N-acetylglucosamine acyltransferase